MNKLTITLTFALIALPLQAQDITNKLGGNDNTVTYDVTDSANNVLLRVQGDGKVGIGTTTPSTKLQIYDGVDDAHIILQDVNTGAGPNEGAWLGFGAGSDLWIWNAENTNLKFGTNSTTRMTIDNNGNVGIGTDAPSTKLQIYDDTDEAHIILQDTNSGTGGKDGAWLGFAPGGDILIWNNENTDLKFGTNNQTRMTVDNDGNVGIGTVTPDATLDVHGTVKAFGAWDGTLSFGTVYTAATDGFVVAYANIGGDAKLEGITGSNSPPTTVRTISERSDPGHINIMMPVKKGDMWKVDRTGVSASGDLFWIPLGQ